MGSDKKKKAKAKAGKAKGSDKTKGKAAHSSRPAEWAGDAAASRQ